MGTGGQWPRRSMDGSQGRRAVLMARTQLHMGGRRAMRGPSSKCADGMRGDAKTAFARLCTGWRSGPVRGPMGGSFKPASAVARIGGTQAGFYGHGVPALSRCAHADDAASSGRCLSRQEGPGDSGSSSRAAGGAPALRSSLGGSGALCPAGALVRPRRCVPAPRCSATQKAEGARSRKNSGRSGNVGRQRSG